MELSVNEFADAFYPHGANYVLKNAVLLFLSFALSVLLGEIMLRFALEPADFLNPVLTKHPQFNTRIYPHSAGHDKWGFRNPSVPLRADLVAIGDSFTYGYLATRDKNWPSFVSQKTGLANYNISMGGWGPSQYLCGMKVYGRLMHPKFVVTAVFLGNDIQQAATDDSQCNILDPEKIVSGYEVVEFKEQRAFDRLRTWLSHNSMSYQVAKASVGASSWLSSLAILHQHDLIIAPFDTTTAVLRLKPLADDQAIQQGIAITIKLLREIMVECEQIAARCHTLLIPSKESIYYPLLRDAIPIKVAGDLKQTWDHEQLAATAIVNAFANSGMIVLNAEYGLRDAIRSGSSIYSVSPDAHLNAAGYQILGSLVVEQIMRHGNDNPAGM